MKKMKKIFALLIAMVMVLGMSTSVFAATIDVDGAIDGETYNAYKILEYTSDCDAYSYYLLDADYQGDLGTALKAAGFEFTQSADKTQWFVSNS